MQQLSQPGEDLFPEISQLQDRLDEAEARLKLTGMIPPRIEQLYRAVMDNLLEGALIILANGTVLYSNNNFAEMVGLRASQMIGSQIFDFVSESDLENFRGALWKAQSGRTKCEVQLRPREGRPVPVLFTMSSTYGQKKTIGAAVLDLTEQKEKEREQRLIQEYLLKKQKKEALGTLAGGIAHDLNNALFPILLSTDMMLLDLPEENPSRSLIQGMKTGAIRAKKLVEQILNFGSHRRMKEKKPVEIGSIVDECLVLVKAGTPANVEIQKDVLDDTALVLATSTHIHQVIMNLCTNAIHAMKDGGGVLRISVKRYKVEKGKSESAFDLSPGAYVRIIVSDTGKGMSRDIMDRIFDPYFTTKKRGEGTGLGLAIAHQIVTDLGGGIAVQSEMGKGTSFEVFLPEIKVPLEGEEGLSSSLPKGTERILFIDDEEICLCSMVPVLERLGYTVCAESSSVAALRMFRQDPRRFDLVVTDQSMPGLTGLELSQEFLKIRPDIPIVLVTGFSAAVDEQKAKQKGIREFMLKPFIIQDVAETIRRACEPR